MRFIVKSFSLLVFVFLSLGCATSTKVTKTTETTTAANNPGTERLERNAEKEDFNYDSIRFDRIGEGRLSR